MPDIDDQWWHEWFDREEAKQSGEIGMMILGEYQLDKGQTILIGSDIAGVWWIDLSKKGNCDWEGPFDDKEEALVDVRMIMESQTIKLITDAQDDETG